MVHGIVMGNLPVEALAPAYPPFLVYCIGLDSQVFDMEKLPQKLHLIEQHLRSDRCVGIKLYPAAPVLPSTTTGSRQSTSSPRATTSRSRSIRA